MSSAASRAPSPLRTNTATVAPPAASSSAIARPIPDAPPVTIACSLEWSIGSTLGVVGTLHDETDGRGERGGKHDQFLGRHRRAGERRRTAYVVEARTAEVDPLARRLAQFGAAQVAAVERDIGEPRAGEISTGHPAGGERDRRQRRVAQVHLVERAVSERDR